MGRPLLLAVVLALAPTPALSAQAPTASSDTLPELRVSRAAGPITLDGDLSDVGWKGAAQIDTFYETQVSDNGPPVVPTVAWITYDARYLYIGLRCEDPEPAKIRAPFVERDQVFGSDDNVAVFLDTRNDRRSAVELRVSPRGVQGDAVYNDATATEDFAPDFFYDTAARITTFGWTAEMRIPFTSMRYPRSDPQTWGILVWRNYPRAFRYAIYSSPIPRGSDCTICHSRPLTGLSGLPSSGGLVAAPYASGQSVATAPAPGAPLGDAENEGDVGLDVKWTPNAGTALDATVNPDFSQVETDVAQIAVNNRFALFFPEKRPFFLEGVDLFETPVQAVYTRTITSPRWGGRATGKLGGASYTVLAADDRGGGTVVLPGPTFSGLAPQDFSSFAGIARVRQDFGASFAGLLATDREIDGGGYNRVFGPDFQLRLSTADRLTGQFLWSETETPNRPDLAPEWNGQRLSGHALEASWTHNTRRVDWNVIYEDYADAFRADDGFVPQVGYRGGNGRLFYNFYPSGLLYRVRPFVSGRYSEDRAGQEIEREMGVGFVGLGRRNLQTVVQVQRETGLVGDTLLTARQGWLLFQIDPSRRFTRIAIDATVGEFPDLANVRVGTGADLNLTLTLRPLDRITLEALGAVRWLDVTAAADREGRLFTAQVYRLKALVHFSPRAYLRLIGQYVATERDPSLYDFPVEARSGDFSGSALFTYKINWQTALYLGYGDDRALDEGNTLRQTSRQLFAKISYAFQF